MFRLNHETKTMSGETLTPYLVEGTNVYCWDRSGNTVAKKIVDFDFGKPTATERAITGVSVIPVTPVYRPEVIVEQQVATIAPPPAIEEEMVVEQSTTITTDAPSVAPTTIGPDAVTVTPDETEDEKVTYVHKMPAVDDYLGDGELQVGGVEIVPSDEVEGRTEFNPVIDDEDYI
jgi:hypothetical protein